jgi:hypothetical protein
LRSHFLYGHQQISTRIKSYGNSFEKRLHELQEPRRAQQKDERERERERSARGSDHQQHILEKYGETEESSESRSLIVKQGKRYVILMYAHDGHTHKDLKLEGDKGTAS